MNKYYIAVGNSRSVYHQKEDCLELKNAKKTTDKPWNVIKRMALDACPCCFED